MDALGGIEFVDYDRQFLNSSYRWLSDAEIKHLIASSDINREEQEKWFMNLFNRKDYYIRGIQYNGIPIGAVGIKKIFNDSGEYWGYIGEKEYWGKGIGKLMLMQMVKDARTIFSLKNLYLKVLHVNERAIGLYKSLGFTIVSDDGSFYIMSLTL